MILKKSLRRGQSILEYSVIISVVVAALFTMTVYVKRAVYANMKLIEGEINVEAVK